MADNTDTGSGLLWFVAGVAIGATAAVLFAPSSGEDTRAQIARKTEGGRASLAESGREMYERGRDMFERGKKLADDAAEMFERGKKLVETTAATLTERGGIVPPKQPM